MTSQSGIKRISFFCSFSRYVLALHYRKKKTLINYVINDVTSFYRSLHCSRVTIHKHLVVSFILRFVIIVFLFEPLVFGHDVYYTRVVSDQQGIPYPRKLCFYIQNVIALRAEFQQVYLKRMTHSISIDVPKMNDAQHFNSCA